MKERTRAPASQPAPSKASSQQRQIEHSGLTWLDIIGPTSANITHLRERYAFDQLALEDVLSQAQRPKLDSYAENEYLFAIFQFPVVDRSQHVGGAAEVDLFVGREYLISLHDGGLRPLRRLFTAASSDEHARAQLMGRGPGYALYRVVDALIKHAFPMADRIDADLARLEAQIYAQPDRQAARALAELRRDIVAMQHILRPNLEVVRALEAGGYAWLRLPPGFCRDLADGLGALIDLIDEQRETIDGLSAALQTMALQRIGDGQRLLTTIALIALPIIIIAAVMGMNLALPFADSPLALPIAVLAMLVLAVGLIAYARYRRWI